MTLHKVKYRDRDLTSDPILFAEAQYQPNVIQKTFKILFAIFNKSKSLTRINPISINLVSFVSDH